MTRLPVVVSDLNNWGTILNAFLSVSHDASGNLVVAQGQALSIIDNSAVKAAIMQIDPSDNNVQILAGTTGTIKFADNTGATIFATSSHTFLLYPNAVIEAFDGSFNNGNILYATSGGITVLQAHPTLNIIELVDSSGNVIFSTKQSATAAAIANGNTITTTGIGEARVAPTGNVTGIILQAGTTPTQEVTVVNESAFTVTFDVVGTSHVADGVSAIIAANRAMFFTWNSAQSKWYHS
jgi:hypothetical protein